MASDQQLIQIYIPPQLQKHAIPLDRFLHQNSQYQMLCVGSFIFLPPSTSSPQTRNALKAGNFPSRLLIIQRASTERGFPNRWEVPGGSSERTDPTILHSAARETFEETGLMLTRFVRQIGRGQEFTIGQKNVLKLNFEIHVAEIKGLAGGNDEGLQVNAEDDIKITLDPAEHQDYAWATEEDLRSKRYQITTSEQHEIMLEAFVLRSREVEHLEACKGTT